ncbi:MAG: hypothetical protein D6785_05985 [Planctomycetota bacterium]|nr:MAG: hypothetical protein D6785_05985 [Planctomycetota bacterium]
MQGAHLGGLAIGDGGGSVIGVSSSFNDLSGSDIEGSPSNISFDNSTQPVTEQFQIWANQKFEMFVKTNNNLPDFTGMIAAPHDDSMVDLDSDHGNITNYSYYGGIYVKNIESNVLGTGFKLNMDTRLLPFPP